MKNALKFILLSLTASLTFTACGWSVKKTDGPDTTLTDTSKIIRIDTDQTIKDTTKKTEVKH
jgi:outer membrane lipopolysaccharide assembly protein LptE/RlpB